VGGWSKRLADDLVTPSQLLRVHELEEQLKTRGVEPVLAEIKQRKPEPPAWAGLLRSAWLLSCLDEIQLQDPTLPAFKGSLHDEIAAEFCRLDRERLAAAVQRVQRAHAVAAVEARNKYPAQSTLVGREAAKRARHLPLRRLFAEAPDVMLALRPCWMASPLSVSQLIPGDRPLFDLVVFDEASQVLPEDAVTSLLRGRQAVIAGDSRQLPPTTFFAAGAGLDDDESDQEGTGGFQSILDVMSAFLEPAWSLDWHYRSRDEALIAYSNHRIYNGRLVTFPGPGTTRAVSHELVPHVPGQGGQEASAAREVQRVVSLILEHAATRPNETLGVITMGVEHANRIEMGLTREREAHPELDGFFEQKSAERYFIKNLERVQGDERDAIILSIGYGKNEAGDLLYRFGPLLQEGGERRLNVAITRARQRMTVVSSFSHTDMRPDYPKLGVRLLRGFLEYAASEGRRLETGTVTDVPLNDFEQSVHDELARHGMKSVGQVGTSKYRIDLVATHPQKPGRFVLAIECDGASYHSAPTARDRDRLRQQQLEALGWRFHRIWSTDWFLRREEEVARALRAFADAVQHADSLDSNTGGSAPVPAVPPTLTEANNGRARGPRPNVRPGRAIDDYSGLEIQSLVSWVLSDGRLSTDHEIISELSSELGFRRRGTRIVAALTDAIRAVKAMCPATPSTTAPA
jgi:very-short-patch-repair endonuclease